MILVFHVLETGTIRDRLEQAGMIIGGDKAHIFSDFLIPKY